MINSPRLLKWQRREYGGIIHFHTNTIRKGPACLYKLDSSLACSCFFTKDRCALASPYRHVTVDLIVFQHNDHPHFHL